MILKIIGHDGKIFNKPLSSNPWFYFFEELTANGHVITSKIDDPIFDVLIMNTYLIEKRLGITKKNTNKIRKILILWEPKQVSPKLHKKSHLDKYDYIYTPSKLWADVEQSHIFNWPQGVLNANFESEINWSERKNNAILISANKFSVIKGELYSLRRAIIEKCSQEDILDLAGIGWSQSKLKTIFSIVKSLIRSRFKNITLRSLRNISPNINNYLGQITDKLSIQRGYKISLVIENSADYISEKLFDALATQNIVVYVGPDISIFGLNKNMVIQTDENSDHLYETLKTLLSLAPGDQFKIMCEQQLEYNKIKAYWNNKKVLSKLANSINAELI